ncbi:MAG: putative capsular polysaccharide synthesis family protein [Verrucomicrobiales bacterium]|nr:putative capsular polysaccharide synthesis family protein [Verrucomicrobiales bacterium]
MITQLRKNFLKKSRRKRRDKIIENRAHEIRAGKVEMPLLVYQMGKVGSSTVTYSLRRNGIECEHIHRILPSNISRVRDEHIERGVSPKDERVGEALWDRLATTTEQVRIITMVREPISRNISAYFQNLKDFFHEGQVQDVKLSRAIDTFLSDYAHDVPLNWFDEEFKAVTGVDVYEHSFDPATGWTRIQEGRIDLLLMRVELDDEQKTKAVSEFVGLPSLRLENENVGSEKDYAKLYQSFKGAITLPDQYKVDMLESKYAKHFYNAEELLSAAEKWRSVPNG